MKMKDINKRFTDLVSEYIKMGFIINPVSMSGSQGEIAKVDLVKDEMLVRIWLDRESCHNWDNEDAFHGHYITLKIGVWNHKASHCRSSWDTVWMKDLEVTSENRFYEIDNEWFTDDLAYVIDCQKIHTTRLRNRNYDEYAKYQTLSDPKYIVIAANYLRNHAGYSRISKNDVKVMKKSIRSSDKFSYIIEYHGNTYNMK